jgi:predicted nucleotidyltransferase
MNLKSIDPEALKPLLDEVNTAFTAVGVDFYLIGAIAKEYWFHRGGKTSEGTKDIDFAVLVASPEDYENIRSYLMDKGYSPAKENAYVLISPSGVQVDILPFGAIEIDETVKVMGDGMTSIRMNGFKEVYTTGTEKAELPTGQIFKTATLPGIVLLKFIAYDDRPEKRLKDARDIASIIKHFFDLQSDFIYEHHLDLFTTESGEDIVDIGAIVIGRELKKLCADNNSLKERVQNILEREVAGGSGSRFIRQMVQETNSDAEKMQNWLKQLLKGFSSY